MYFFITQRKNTFGKFMKPKNLLLSLFLLLSGIVFAQQNISDKFLIRSQTYQGKTIPYRLFVPENYNPAIAYPLMLCLHGSGERGADNHIQVVGTRLATSWADSINQINNPCFVVAPQCPTDEDWINGIHVDHVPITLNMLTVMNILDSLGREFNIDTNRTYITGLSMGGFGTWDIIERYPDKFAAAIPICSGGDTTAVARIEHIPIWDFHGKIDPIIPVRYSRVMISSFEKNGKHTVYTDCNTSNCIGLPDTTIQRLINEGADLLYTEYEFGVHEIWNQAYDTPLLHNWVFKQYKIPNGVSITNFDYHKKIEGLQEIKWTSALSGGNVDISYSADNGKNWQKLVENYPNNGSFLWDSEKSEDGFFGLLKILIRDVNNILYAHYTTGNFTLKNDSDGKPFVEILNKELNMGAVITTPEYQLKLLTGDLDADSVKVDLYYSPDGANSKVLFDSFHAPSDTIPCIRNIDLQPLQNSNQAILHAYVSNGVSSYSDSVYYFQKNTLREPLPLDNVQPISKFYDVPFTVNLVDSTESSGKEYMLTFDDSSSVAQKYFNVFDISSNQYIVQHSKFYPNSESIIFNGFSFITNDVYTKLDLAHSRWNSSVSKSLTFSASPFFLNANYPEYNGYGKPNNYKIIFYGTVVDTSVADTLFPITPSNIITAKPVSFKVFNINSGKQLDVVYFKTGTISSTYSIWFKEDVTGKMKRTWKINIVDNEPNRIIPAGDTLFIYTYKGLSIYDSIKITSKAASAIALEENINPSQFKLYQNYPNPFNPATHINYFVPLRSHVQLRIYDILGKEVMTLVNGELNAGSYNIELNMSNFASGIYFYQLRAGSFFETKKLMLLK
jgi:poly(3-hydroxybutyrate) depolymerase